MTKQSFMEHVGTPLRHAQTPEEKEAVRPLVEKLTRRQKHTQDFFDKLFARRDEPVGDIPIKSRPVLPDWSDLVDVRYEVVAPEVTRLETDLANLREQFLLVSNRMVQIPDEIEALEKQFALNPSAGIEDAIRKLEREAKVLRDHRQPDLRSVISSTETRLVSAKVESDDAVIEMLVREAKDLDSQIVDHLRQAFRLRVRSNAVRNTANSLMSSSSDLMGDWVKIFGRLVMGLWDSPAVSHITSLESTVVERMPERFHYKG